MDMLSDPLRVDTVAVGQPAADTDPFDNDTPQDGDAFARNRFFLQDSLTGPNGSEASLIPAYRTKSMASSDYNDVDLDDDEARLTSFAAGSSAGERDAHTSLGQDIERTPDSRSRRRSTIRYSMTPSTGERLRSVKRNLRRVSLRVVNLAGAGLEEKMRSRGVRLPDDDDNEDKIGTPPRSRGKERLDDSLDEDEPMDYRSHMPIRGRTLGFLGPKSRLRLAMFRFLTYTYVSMLRVGGACAPLYILNVVYVANLCCPAGLNLSSSSLSSSMQSYSRFRARGRSRFRMQQTPIRIPCLHLFTDTFILGKTTRYLSYSSSSRKSA